MSGPGGAASCALTRAVRRHLVGPRQSWVFTRPPAGYVPPALGRTSIYLHVPFCRNDCPYCPYTKVPFTPDLVTPYERAALAEVDWWARAIGPAEITSVYAGGGTPTLALQSVTRILERVRERFRVTGDVCLETSPAEVDDDTVRGMHEAGATMVSLGVQSFSARHLKTIGRRYSPTAAEGALARLVAGNFAAVNADLMFALPGQTAADVTADLDRAARLGADQVTAYPLFTFPYTAVGEYLRLSGVRLPHLGVRREHYRAVTAWARGAGFERVSVWGFRRGTAPRYSSVTRDGYLGIGPGAGSHLPDGFVLNTFDLEAWTSALADGGPAFALRLPFSAQMSGWWWLYWRIYDTRIPTAQVEEMLGPDAPKARRWLRALQTAGLLRVANGSFELTDAGTFWLHLAQNHFALAYVNTLWTAGRREAWPRAVAV